MGLRKHLVGLPFDARFAYDADRNVLYLNFEHLEVKTPQMVDAILAKVRAICEPLGRRVHAVVNYEGFLIDRDVEERYAEMATEAVSRYYESVTRFTTSAFLRAKLGEALAQPQARAAHLRERSRGTGAFAPASARLAGTDPGLSRRGLPAAAVTCAAIRVAVQAVAGAEFASTRVRT